MKSDKPLLSLQSSVLTQEPPIKEMMVKLRSFISRRCANTDNVSDLVQETLIKTLTRKNLSEIENLQAYANQVAKSVMYNDWQKNINQPDNAEAVEQFTLDSSDPETQTINQQKVTLVNEILGTMPPLRKKVFEMRRIDGLSRSEIAKQLQISEESVKKHITRAMVQITSHLEESQ